MEQGSHLTDMMQTQAGQADRLSGGAVKCTLYPKVLLNCHIYFLIDFRLYTDHNTVVTTHIIIMGIYTEHQKCLISYKNKSQVNRH